MRRMTGIVAGTALAAAALAMAACQPPGSSASGSSGTAAPAPATAPATGTPSDGHAVAAAYQKTVTTGSAHITTQTQVGVGSASAPITASGVIGFTDGAADLTETLPGGQGSAETRFVNGVLYERLPGALISSISGGKPWIALDVNKMSGQGNGSMGQVMANSPTDPSQILAYLKGAGDHVQVIGPDTVDGTPTTHYTVLIDLDKSVQGQDGTAVNAVHVLEQQLGSHTLPAQVWLDNQGHLRKLSIDATLRGATGGNTSTPPSPSNGNITFQFTATLSDFGVPVHVIVPPADQTANVTNLLNGNH